MENLEEKIERVALKIAQSHIHRHPPYYGQIPVELGSPWESGYVESLIGRLRDELLECRDL